MSTKATIKTIFLSILLFVTGIMHSQIPGIELLGGWPSKKFKFKFVQGFIIMDVRYGGVFPLKFIIDTGSKNTIILDKLVAELLPIKYDRSIYLYGADLTQKIEARVARNLIFKFDQAQEIKKDAIVLFTDLLQLSEVVGEPIHGIIGADFFKGLIVKIDYQQNEITLYNAIKFDKKKFETYQEIPAIIVDGKPYINATVKIGNTDSTQVKLLLDTGASISFMLHNNTSDQLYIPPNHIKGHIGKGLSGDLLGFVGKVKQLQIGTYSFENSISYFQDINIEDIDSSAIIRNGIIGNYLLDRFLIYIDYTKSKVYFKAAKKYNRPFDYDKSGISVQAHGVNLKTFIINEVIEGSPAWEAGLKQDDQIIAINFYFGKDMSLNQLTRVLSSKAGKTIKIKVKRNGEKLKFRFKLKELI